MPRLQSRRFSTAPTRSGCSPTGGARCSSSAMPWSDAPSMSPACAGTADMPEIAGTPTCQLHHLGYAISGVHARGDATTARSSTSKPSRVPPSCRSHDAWVVGDEPWVTVEWTSARTFAVAPQGPGERVLATVLFTDIVDLTSTLECDSRRRSVARLPAAHNRLCATNSTRSGDARSPRRAMGSWRASTGATRAVRCGAAMAAIGREHRPRDPRRHPHRRSGVRRFGCTRRRRPRGGPGHVVRGGLGACSSRQRPRTCWMAPACSFEDAGDHAPGGSGRSAAPFRLASPGERMTGDVMLATEHR